MPKRAEELEGLVPPSVCAALREHASRVLRGQCIVEIGSYKGKSTCALAEGAPDGVPVYAVDPWDSPGNVTGRFGFADPVTRQEFDRQVREAGHEDVIIPVQSFSVHAARAFDGPPIGLLYIDGDHGGLAVRDDYRSWERHLGEPRTVIFDDLDTPKNPGVRRAIEQIGLSFEIEAKRLAVSR